MRVVSLYLQCHEVGPRKMERKCCLCNEPLSGQGTVTLTDKGCKGLLKAATERGDTELTFKGGQEIHISCRRSYVDPKRIARKRKSTENVTDRCTLRSHDLVFKFNEDCLFCGKSITETKRIKVFKESYPVRTADFQRDVFEKCKERNDSWGHTVMYRIEYSGDLHASDVQYHQSCSVRFRIGKELESNESQENR